MNVSSTLVSHVEILLDNYLRLTGRELIAPGTDSADTAMRLTIAPFVVVSHGIQEDPVFNYANNIALELFEMTWDEFTALPSRLSAEPVKRSEIHDQGCYGLEFI